MEEKEAILVKCASCKKLVDYRDCYDLYMGMGTWNYICEECQTRPFIEVMKNSMGAESYIGEPPKTLEELQKRKREMRKRDE